MASSLSDPTSPQCLIWTLDSEPTILFSTRSAVSHSTYGGHDVTSGSGHATSCSGDDTSGCGHVTSGLGHVISGRLRPRSP